MPKERISVTIDNDLIDWIDEKIKEKVFATRSHAFEFAVKTLKEKETNQDKRKYRE